MKKKNQYLKIKNDTNEYILQMQMLKQLINQPVNETNKVASKTEKQVMKIEARA